MSRKIVTAELTRGLRRRLAELGVEALPEFVLRDGLRADLLALGPDAEIWIVEVKSGREDFLADDKWRGYLPWCDRFFFGVDAAFPLALLPETVGVMRADAWGAELLRLAAPTPLAPARRKAILLKAARDACARLRRLEDPDPGTRFAPTPPE